jgi:beta-exotoxin I transport system permease protein
LSGPTFTMALRLRIRSTGLAALGMALVIVMVGALFPSVGGSIGKLDLPEGVSELLGGADYATLAGWMRSEIGAVYGPLVIGGVAITAAAGSTAGEEEDGILGLVLAHPIGRTHLIRAKAAAVAVSVLIVAFGTFVGLVLGVAVAGGGIGLDNLLALAVHLAFFGFAVGAVALAIAGFSGRRAVAAGGAAAYAILGFLINGFAPLVDGLTGLKYVSPFYYYSGHDPLGSGLDVVHLAILGAASVALVAFAALAFQRRDLRA